MNICPNCGSDQLKETQSISIAELIITSCAICDAVLSDCITLTREEALILTAAALDKLFIPRDLYDVAHPLIMKIIRFAETGKENKSNKP